MFRQNHVVDNPFFFVYNIYIYKSPTKIEPKSNQVGYIPLFTHLEFPLCLITSLGSYPMFGHSGHMWGITVLDIPIIFLVFAKCSCSK